MTHEELKKKYWLDLTGVKYFYFDSKTDFDVKVAIDSTDNYLMVSFILLLNPK